MLRTFKTVETFTRNVALIVGFSSDYYPSKRADSDPNRICVSDWLKTFEKDLDYTIQPAQMS